MAEVQNDASLRMAKVLDKALAMAESARSPRELHSAVAAVSSSYGVFEKASGIGGSAARGKAGNTFNFNFGGTGRPPAKAVRAAEEVVEAVTD